ncbi:glycosyl transferase [Maritimibacter sp. 55A14]|uniref:transglycosylase domain-containing protein n=1 Tax=Maritimibacter sp. 55A14 TaxID=2174844 RepID=UPI000D60F07E|nr:PBP1A family penicillin-binding protein [Maritimibacter sp. 55A14]PWE32655.1 glycosyl transferase [Maritimibacter sp. 55A14]
MSGNGRKRPHLVADRRTTRPKARKAAPAKRRAAKRPAKRRSWLVRVMRSFLRLVFRLLWGIGWRSAAILAMVLAGATFFFYLQLPPKAFDLVDGRTRGSVTLLDRDGEPFAWRGDMFGGAVTAGTVSEHLKNAVVATEDKRFYRHFGISPRGIAGAIRINLSEGRGPLSGHGGSTITQQVAKLLCLGVAYDPEDWKNEAEYESDCRRTTLWRKIKEVPFALAMEAKYTKDEILSIYLNRAYLGAGARGFEAASQRYFGKSAASVRPAEAAMLAGLLVAPSYYAPTSNMERARNRAAVVLSLMQQQGYLSAQSAAAARENPAGLSDAARAEMGGYFADWVMEEGPDFLTRDTTEDVVIRTTFDPRLQRAAEEAVQKVFDEKVRDESEAQAAVVVMSADGAVRAVVGGRQMRASGLFNRATQAKRQTGSAFKPFVYAAALDLGFRFDSVVVDEPVTLDIPGSGEWSPRNYDGKFRGEMRLTDALAQSINTVAVKVSEAVGRENVRKVATDFGIQTDLASGAALALGTSETTLMQMTGAFAGILNGGSSVKPYGMTSLRLQGEREPLMQIEGGVGERVISTSAARQLTYMMSRVTEAGTGRRAALPDRLTAGKTGTTQAARDAWFVGFTADYVAGVWMGYDDNSPLTGVTGGGLPAEIWRETMIRVHEGLEPRPLPMIDPVAEATPGMRAPRTERRIRRGVEQSILDEVLGAIFGRRN